MNIRTQSLVLVSLLAAAGCSAVLPASPQIDAGASVLAAASRQASVKRSVFNAWDTDKDGKLSLTEYANGFLSVISPAPTPDEQPAFKALIDAEFQRLDRNKDGFLTYSEFRAPNASQLGSVSAKDVIDGNAFLDPTTGPGSTPISPSSTAA